MMHGSTNEKQDMAAMAANAERRAAAGEILTDDDLSALRSEAESLRPAACRKVTKSEFFATMGPLSVHPYPQGRYQFYAGYLSEWRLPCGRVVGFTLGGTVSFPAEYYLKEGAK